jgi:lactoylglutathione lyase
MKTLHAGLRVADLERSPAFCTALGCEVLGAVPAAELGSLTMLKLADDGFVALELVHDPPAGLTHADLTAQAEGADQSS